MFLIPIFCIFTVLLQFATAECPTTISRKEWGAEKPKHVNYLNTPVELVIIQHTVTQSCLNDESCVSIVRDLQKTHVNEAFLWDIGPSFLIANTGKIYEGRGWNHVAIHTYGYNNQSFGIAFIGNFNNQEPSIKALDAARALIQCGIDQNRLTSDHQVVMQKQLVPTDSPGKNLASKILSWPDWKSDVTEIKKKADTEDIQTPVNNQETEDNLVESRAAGESRPKREILTKPKEIDLMSNARDVIAELIDNIHKLAQQTLKTTEALARGLFEQLALFLEKLASRLRWHKNQINLAISDISMVPGIGQCLKLIQGRADSLYDTTEVNAKSCADKRVNEIDSMIKNLGALSSNAIKFSNTAVEETRNCTELNYGIESATRACLNSVTSQTRSHTAEYESQRTLAKRAVQIIGNL